jgi:hypothetical protein
MRKDAKMPQEQAEMPECGLHEDFKRSCVTAARHRGCIGGRIVGSDV